MKGTGLRMVNVRRMDSLIPSYIENLVPYKAGKSIEEVKRQYGLERVIKLASNENPFGPSPLALRAAFNALGEVNRYPDPAAGDLRTALARYYGVPEENIVIGNGSESILAALIRVFLRQGDEVVTSQGTFVGFLVLCRSMGVEPVVVPLKEYRFDLRGIAEKITPATKMVYLCNPNNPTGTIFTKTEFEEFMHDIHSRVLVIVDEAYFEYAKQEVSYPDSAAYGYENLITLRTFSKVYGLAGLRVGYAFGPRSLIKSLWKVKLPFEPTMIAQKAAEAALQDRSFVDKTLSNNERGLRYLYEELARLKIKFVHSFANFVLVDLDSSDMVNRLFYRCLREGIVLRPLAQVGLPGCMRITVGLPQENRVCVNILEKALTENTDAVIPPLF